MGARPHGLRGVPQGRNQCPTRAAATQTTKEPTMPDYAIALIIFAVLFSAALAMRMYATRPRRRR